MDNENIRKRLYESETLKNVLVRFDADETGCWYREEYHLGGRIEKLNDVFYALPRIERKAMGTARINEKDLNGLSIIDIREGLKRIAENIAPFSIMISSCREVSKAVCNAIRSSHRFREAIREYNRLN